jgi:hypothetical protein
MPALLDRLLAFSRGRDEHDASLRADEPIMAVETPEIIGPTGGTQNGIEVDAPDCHRA